MREDSIRLTVITGHYEADLQGLNVVASLAASLPPTYMMAGSPDNAERWLECMDVLREHAPDGYMLDYQQGPEGKGWLASPKGDPIEGRWLCYVPDPLTQERTS